MMISMQQQQFLMQQAQAQQAVLAMQQASVQPAAAAPRRTSSNATRVPGFRAEAPRGRGGLAPRLIPSLPPIPRNYEYKMCGFCGARKDLSEPRARGLALMGPVLREQIKRP